MDLSRKNIILIVVASSVGFFLLLLLGLFLFFNSQFSVYQDGRYKFSIKYPKTWEVVIHPYENVAVVFKRPKDTALDIMQENFSVSIQWVPADILTLEAFSGTVRRQLTGTFGKNIHIVEDAPLQWDWRQGHMIAYEDPKPDHLMMVNAWVIRGNQAFILTFLGDMNKYTQDAAVVHEMIRSLQLQ